MSPEDADARIIKSHQTLAVYQRMNQAGMKLDADIGLMDAEIAVLVDLAQAHNGKCDKIASLIGQWRDLMEKVRTVH